MLSAASAALGSQAARPCVLAVTGSIGMGKSTASEWMRKTGLRVHDSDATVHSLYAAGGAATGPIEEAFPGVRAPDGSIDRAALSKAVATVGREESLKTLEKIVHPLVSASRRAFVEEAAADGEWLVVVDVPLLFETHADEQALRASGVDSVLVVSAPADVQRARVLARPGMSEEKLEAILARQMADAEKRARADVVVATEGFPVARAQLASAVADLAVRHAPRWEAWLARRPGGGGGSFPRARAVTFDLDDTLWPVMPPLLRAQDELVSRLMPTHMPRAVAAGDGTKEAMRAAMRPAAEANPLIVHDLTELRRLSLGAMAAEHGDDPAAVTPLLDAFVEARAFHVAADQPQPRP